MSRRPSLSVRLREVVDALPIGPGSRVLEIGCGPGAAAIEVAARVGPTGHVLAVDRSPRATAQLCRTGAELIAAGRLTVLTIAIEQLTLPVGVPRSHVAFAIRVGALDGRHPQLQEAALRRVAAALVPDGRLFVDGGDPLREVPLRSLRPA